MPVLAALVVLAAQDERVEKIQMRAGSQQGGGKEGLGGWRQEDGSLPNECWE